jgi:hypothetical protein
MPVPMGNFGGGKVRFVVGGRGTVFCFLWDLVWGVEVVFEQVIVLF